MTGVESIIRLLILLVFAAFFIMPLIFLVIGPTKPYTDWYDRTLSPLHFGALSGYVTAWNNIAMFGEGLIKTWVVNSVWYSIALGSPLSGNLYPFRLCIGDDAFQRPQGDHVADPDLNDSSRFSPGPAVVPGDECSSAWSIMPGR